MRNVIPPSHSHLWSLGDQALVSGSNFITGVLLARLMGLEAFGAYVVAQAYLLYANTFQASLVVSPMMTAIPAETDERIQRRLIRGFFGYTILVLCITLAGVQLLAWLLGLWSEHLSLGKLAWPLLFAMGGFQLQDWLRRALYIKAANRAVFFSDLLAYGGQLVGLAWLWYGSNLTPITALLALAITFAFSALATALSHGIRPDPGEAAVVIKQHWRTSRNFLVTWQLQWLGSQGVILLGAGMIGQQAAGAIRAAQNLLGPINVAFQWMDNVVPVRAALHLRDSGQRALVAYLGRIGVVGGVVLGLFSLALLPIDEWLMVLLYGEEYRPFAILVVFQALYYFFGHGYRMAAYYYRAVGETLILAHASLWWAVISVTLALITVRGLGERGIMVSLIAGEVAALVYLLWSWRAKINAPLGSNNSACKPCYVVLRRRDGSIHLVLPFLNTQVLQSALRMYYPSRWAGRMYRSILALTLPWRAWLGWVETVETLAGFCPDLSPVLKEVATANPECIGLLKGAPGPRSKLTLKIMDAAGNSLAYARIADSPGAVAALRREAQVLTMSKLGPCQPIVIAQGEYSGPHDFFIVESAGPEQPAEPVLAERHFAFLARMLGDETIPWHSVIDQLEHEISDLMREPGLSSLLAEALKFLLKAPCPSLRVCIEHGDFVPWNVRVNKTGELFVLDWEHARRDGWVWLDALHFCYQTEALVRRRSPKQVLASLLSVFTQPAARQYAQQLPVTAGHERTLITVYLLRMLVVGASEGYAVTAHQQAMRCRMLKHLLQEINIGSYENA
jgi:O-antigen/teichoic acid export membrane protein